LQHDERGMRFTICCNFYDNSSKCCRANR
jgi:hypothetical protein